MADKTKSIQDKYEILSEIGKGGMATVYKANQVSLDRIVAIKEISPAIASSPELVERFKREARASASLVHENIIQVYNFGEPKKGALFIVLEYLDGEDLKTALKRSNPVPARIAAIIARDVARGLAYAHSKGFIHRDVKPGNVMISAGGEVKLMDFGIVREIDSDLTRTGAFLGTPSYMSPEQFLGDTITPSSDVFSLGVLLYEMLSGVKPFAADNESSLSKKVRTEKEEKIKNLNSSVPRKLQKIVHNSLKKEPDKRTGSAEELVVALESFLKSRSRDKERRELAGWYNSIFDGESTAEVEAPEKPKKKAAKPAETVVVDSKPDSGPRARRLARTSAQIEDIKSPEEEKQEKTRQAPKETGTEEPKDTAEVVVKWIWRSILLAIAIIAGVTVFLLFTPTDEKTEETAKERSTVERVMDWFDDKFDSINKEDTEGKPQG